MQMTPHYSSLGTSVFEKVGSAVELELDLLHSILKWGGQWLATFNGTKTKLISLNHHGDPLLVLLSPNHFLNHCM